MRIAFLVVVVLATRARGEGAEEIFRVWDLNKDGILTKDELPDAGVFEKVDRDGDGKATRAEVEAFLGVKPPTNPDSQAPKPEGGKPPVPAAPEKKSEAAPKKDPKAGTKEEKNDFFARFDTNKDGKISLDEFRAGEEAFRKYDRNRDNFLNEKEVVTYLEDRLREARRRPRPDNFMELFDANGDGKVTKREYDGPGEFFRMYDHNRDDAVTEAELNMGPLMAKMPAREAEKGNGDGPTPLPRKTILERYDKDGDGRITLDELGGADSILQRLDRNGDGVLSGSEVR